MSSAFLSALVGALVGTSAVAAVGAAGRARRCAARAPVVARLVTARPAAPTRPPAGPVLLTVGAVVAVGGLGLSPVAVGATGIVLAVAVGVGLPRWRARAERRRADAQLPDALDAVAAQLRRGSSLLAAIDGAAVVTPPPLGPQLAVLAMEGRHRGLAEALERLAAGDGPLTALSLPLAVALRVDADPTLVVTGVARARQADDAVRAEVDAHVAQARLSGLVMALTRWASGRCSSPATPAPVRSCSRRRRDGSAC